MHDWGRLTQAERDARYNNSAAVKNSAEYMAAMTAASAERRAASPARLDLPYGPQERNKVDFFPAADPAAPCLVFIHGGYWQRNGREGSTVLADGVRAHGWAAALPGYTLAPEASLTTIVAEIAASLDHIRNLVTGRIILSGWSAGGHLCAMSFGHTAVHAALAISGVYELGPIRDTYLNEKARITDEEIATLSPLRLPVGPKELAIAYGSNEVPPIVNDSRPLHQHRASAHAPGALIPVPGMDHFTTLDSLKRADGMLTRVLLGLA